MTRQINLFNPTLRLKREWLTGKSLLWGISVMVVLLGLYGALLRWDSGQLAIEAKRVGEELTARQEELSRLNHEIASRKVSSETQAALRRAEATLRGRERVGEAMASGALGSPEGFSEFLIAFARQTQEGLWMVGLQMAEGGRDITLEGRTLNSDRLPAYIRGLNGEPILRGRSFAALNVQLVGGEEPAMRASAADQGAQDAVPDLPPFHAFMLTATSSRSGVDGATMREGSPQR